MSDLSRMPPVKLRSPRYTTWQTVNIDEWRNDSGAPPTASYREFESDGTELPVKQFANSGDPDAASFLWVLPTEIYKPDDVTVYLGYAPGASWTEGGYQWRIGYTGKNRDGGTLGSGSMTTLYDTDTLSTPSAATDIIEWLFGTLTVGTNEMFNCQLWLDTTNTTADDVGEAIWVRFEYTAWRVGSALHPMQGV